MPIELHLIPLLHFLTHSLTYNNKNVHTFVYLFQVLKLPFIDSNDTYYQKLIIIIRRGNFIFQNGQSEIKWNQEPLS